MSHVLYAFPGSRFFEGFSQEKEESIGDRTFSVMSSPVRNAAGEVVAAVEVLRETTQLKKLYQEMQEQNLKLKNEVEMARRLQESLLPDPRTFRGWTSRCCICHANRLAETLSISSA